MTKHLFTDASFLESRAIASWSAMLVSGLESHVDGELFNPPPATSNLCELLGVLHAVRMFKARGLIRRRDHIIVHSDSKQVVGIINGMSFRKAIRPTRDAATEMLETFRDLRLDVEALWVGAHQEETADCWRALVNRRVDIHARQLTGKENRRRLQAGDKKHVLVLKKKWIIA